MTATTVLAHTLHCCLAAPFCARWLVKPGGMHRAASPIGRAPSRAEPSRAEPSRAEPSRAEPSRAEPSRRLCVLAAPTDVPSCALVTRSAATATKRKSCTCAWKWRRVTLGAARRARTHVHVHYGGVWAGPQCRRVGLRCWLELRWDGWCHSQTQGCDRCSMLQQTAMHAYRLHRSTAL